MYSFTAAVDDDLWDFLGIDTSRKVLQHASWTAKDGCRLEAVGDLQLQTVRSVTLTATEQLTDVVGLGQMIGLGISCLLARRGRMSVLWMTLGIEGRC
jgi:hypothetical protein